jgi:acyl dehydratase
VTTEFASAPQVHTDPRPGDEPVPNVVHDPQQLFGLVGHQFGPSPWLPVPQSDINLFAEATHDKQWIHVDVERAKTGPFGGPIAHGYLTLSLLSHLFSEIVVIENLSATVNYGLNRVRFPAPVSAASRVRLTATLTNAEPAKDSIQATIDAVINIEGSDKPACTAQMVYRYYPLAHA